MLDSKIYRFGISTALFGEMPEPCSKGSFMAMSRLLRIWGVWVTIFAILTLGTIAHAEPPDRSTRYDGASRVVFGDYPAFRPLGDLTVEAWILREDAGRCETIASKNFRDSWWLGFCPRLRFYTSNSTFVDADRDIPTNQWCHVAVTVDVQGFARFFIDGEAAGTGTLPAVTHNSGPMTLGSDIDGNLALAGSIDELRIWDVARDGQDIVADLFREVRAAPDLLAVFPEGGTSEIVHGRTGTPHGSPVVSSVGLLPHDVSVPAVSGALTLDGRLNTTEYQNGDKMVLRYHAANAPRDAIAHIVANSDWIWVGIDEVWPRVENPTKTKMTLLYDPEPEVSDKAFGVVVSMDGVEARRFTRDGLRWAPCTNLAASDCRAPSWTVSSISSRVIARSSASCFRPRPPRASPVFF
jgi:hypothetical protein